jgi:hypothetical protein
VCLCLYIRVPLLLLQPTTTDDLLAVDGLGGFIVVVTIFPRSRIRIRFLSFFLSL